jgi:hypothetical protein
VCARMTVVQTVVYRGDVHVSSCKWVLKKVIGIISVYVKQFRLS